MATSIYEDLTHEEVLLLQEELGKLPTAAINWIIGCVILITILFLLTLYQLGLITAKPSAVLFFMLLLLGLLVWGLRMNFKQRRLLKKDIIHRQKKARTLIVVRKERAFADNTYRFFSRIQEEPVLITQELYEQIEKGDEIIIWESVYAKLELTKEKRELI